MIIFARPHFHYDSFTDFWKLVELSGFEWCWIKEIDLKRNVTYIVSPILEPTRDEWQLSWWQRKRKNARLILWDLERPKPRGGLKANGKFLAHQHFDEIWHSDARLAQDMNTRFVILGSDKRLGAKPALFKRYNFTHMSHENGRRATIFEKLGKLGPNGWGRHRREVLRRTRFGLTVHQDNDLYIEPLRLALFAAYQLPVISETAYNSFPAELITADYGELVNLAQNCLSNYRQLKEFGRELWQTLCIDYNFGNVVRYTVMN